MENNRQTRQKCRRVLQQQKTFFKLGEVQPVVYNNDDYLLTLNDKKNVPPNSKNANCQPPRSYAKGANKQPYQPAKSTRRQSPSHDEIAQLLKLIEGQTENQQVQTQKSMPHRTGRVITRTSNNYTNDIHTESLSNPKQKPVRVAVVSPQRGRHSGTSNNRNIVKCNYRKGDNEKWANDPTTPDSRLYFILRNKFGLKEFRHNQKAIVKCSLAGSDVFVCMPTGGGKSLTFQLPLAYEPGLTVCIMPLVSLIFDQECLSKKLGLKAYSATGSTAVSELQQFYSQLAELENLQQGIILLTTPEKMTASNRLLREIEQVYNRNLLSRFVIDEVHCVSTWGRDFREDYANLGFLKKTFPKVPVLALTATATQQVKVDVISKLGIQQCYFFQSSFNRPNLFYSVRNKSKKLNQEMVEICRKYSGQSGIVYCLSKKDCEKVAQMLNKERISADFYYADLKSEHKKDIQTRWMNNKILVIVATIAFGMGINKPDVRFVIHHTMSKSLENYYQESGRAGRDGDPAECILFYRRHDKILFTNLNLQNEFATTESKDFNTKSLMAMVRYGEQKFECRRVFQLQYLGEEFLKEQCDKTCDNCKLNLQYRQIECLEGVREMGDLLTQTTQIRQTLTLSQLTTILVGATNKQLAQKLQFIGRKGVDVSQYEYFRTWKPAHVQILAMNLLNEGVLREETFSSGKFTHSEVKVDQHCFRKFIEQDSYSIRIEANQKQKYKVDKPVIQQQTEYENDDDSVDPSMFDQFARNSNKGSAIDPSSDDELLQLLESERNNRLLFKYVCEPEKDIAVAHTAQQDDQSQLLRFLADNEV